MGGSEPYSFDRTVGGSAGGGSRSGNGNVSDSGNGGGNGNVNVSDSGNGGSANISGRVMVVAVRW